MTDLSHLTQAILDLPLHERVRIAQELWASLQPNDGAVENETADALTLADRRDAELDAGSVDGISHQQAMDAARKSLE
jgi:putative addiction module component (TIGR02574 family)